MIRTSPQPGDIGLTIITGRVGRLVQLGQWLNGEGRRRPGWDLDDEVPYQHAFVVLPSGLLIEAMPGGAQVRPLSAYDDRDVLYVSPAGLTDAQRKAIGDCALKYRDVPYSFLDYLALAAHRFHLPVPGLRRYIQSTGHQICSQLADRAYLDAGVHLFTDQRWEGYVTPMSIYQELAGRSGGGTVTASGPRSVAAGGSIGVAVTGTPRRPVRES